MHLPKQMNEKRNLREADESCWVGRGRDGQLDVVGCNSHLGLQTTVMVKIGAHFQTRLNKVGEVSSNLSHNLNGSRWLESHLTL